MPDDTWREDGYNTILEALKGEGVAKFEVRGNRVLISEKCDDYFSISLMKEELQQLIRELQTMHDEMPG